MNKTIALPAARAARMSAAAFFVMFAAVFWFSATAHGFSLNFPLKCTYATDCFIQNYVDTDPSDNYQDFRCGGLSYDTHTGTDFFVLPEIYGKGVPVLAAAPGVVRAVRDGVPDMNMRVAPHSVKGREAGNAVAITHEGGWETRYNHLRKGSVAVRPGQKVETGQFLGTVGLSGKTEFPHLELVVAKDGEPVDPFTGRGVGQGCNQSGTPLWNAATAATVKYIATGAIGAGFTDSRMDISHVRTGYASKKFSPRIKTLFFWATLIGVRKGDMAIVTMYAPSGKVLARRKTEVKKNQVRQMLAVGVRRRETSKLPTGEYRGEYVLYRSIDGEKRLVATARAQTQVR